MKTLEVGNVLVIFDAADEELIMQHRWNLDSDGYARTTIGTRSNQKTVRMHQLILAPKDGWVIDHKNRDITDNRRPNLRYATLTENNYNAKIRKDNSSGYRGVSAYGAKWRVSYMKDGRRTHGGYFKDKEDAATAYNFYLAEVSNGFGQYNEVDQPWLDYRATRGK